MIRTIDEKIFLNPRSVGTSLRWRSPDKLRGLARRSGEYSFALEYDVNVTAKELSRAGFLSLLCARLSEILAKA
jgi:hypothetical protein